MNGTASTRIVNRVFRDTHDILYFGHVCSFIAHGILKSLRARFSDSKVASVTKAELHTAVRKSMNKQKQGNDKNTSDNTTSTASTETRTNGDEYISTVESGKKIMYDTAEQAFENRKKFYALRRMYGSSQVFFTISPDDLKTFNVLRYAGKSRDEIYDMSAAERESFAAANPVAAATHFHDMLKVIIKHCFAYDIDKERSTGVGAFGSVEAFGIKIEEQHRGALHAHMLLHIRGLPKTAAEMLELWQKGDTEPLLRYIERCQWETNFVPRSAFECEKCADGTLLKEIPFSDDIVRMKTVGAKEMEEPATLECPTCQNRKQPCALASEWVQSVIECSKEQAESGFRDHPMLEKPLLSPTNSSVTSTMLDGGPRDGVKVDHAHLALIASRAIMFQRHRWQHTKSCFKGTRTCFCR